MKDNQSPDLAIKRFREFTALSPKGSIFVWVWVGVDQSGLVPPIIAGLAGTAQQWEPFCADWQRLLNAHPVPSCESRKELLSAQYDLIESSNFIFSKRFAKPTTASITIEKRIREVADVFFGRIVPTILSGNEEGVIIVILGATGKIPVSDAYFTAQKQWPQLQTISFGSGDDLIGVQAAKVFALSLSHRSLEP